jgi:hypothetical protein
MKNLIILILSLAFIFVNFQINAQSSRSDIEWSSPFSEGGVATLKGFHSLGQNKDGVYYTKLVRTKAFKSDLSYYLEYYDFNTKKRKSKQLEFEGKIEHKVEETILIGETVVVFTSIFSKREDNVKLFAHIFNSKDFRKTKSLELMEFKLGKLVVWEMVPQGYFKCIPSPENEKLLIFGRYYDNIQYKVLDNKLEELSTGTTTISKKNRLVDFAVSNQGDIILVGINEKMDKIQIYNCPFEKDFLPLEEINVANNRVGNVESRWTIDNELVFTGYYFNEKKDKVKGMFSFDFDGSTRQIKNSRFEELPASYEFEVSPGYIFFLSPKIFWGEGGNHWIVMELFSSEFNNNSVAYHYKDLLVINRGGDGTLKWIKQVPKHQISTNKQGSNSYNGFVRNGNLHLIYNDHENNLKQSGSYKPKKLRNPMADNVLVVETIDEKSLDSRNRKIISSEYPLMYPSTLQSMPNGEFVFIGEYNMKYQVGKVQIN